MSALAFRTVTKRFGARVALDAVSLSIGPSEYTALVGDNGSGKTTLFQLAAGLTEPTEGDVSVADAPAGSLAARRALSFLADTPSLYDDLSVREHFEYVGGLYGDEEWSDRAESLLGRLGVAERADDLPSGLSRGMRQKVSIALAIARPCEVLVLDEPFSGLDPASRRSLATLLSETNRTGVAVVVSSHRLDELGRVDRCIRLADGKVVSDGAPSGGFDP